MYRNLLKTRPKTAVPKRFLNGSQMVPKWFPDGSQNALVLSVAFPKGEALRDSVSFFSSCCHPRCCSVHMPTWVRDTTILALSGGLEISVSYETAGAN